MSDSALNSSIYVGEVQHRRFSPKQHHFNYSLYMLAIDVDEIGHELGSGGLFGYEWWRPLRLNEKDYLKSDPGSLKQRIKDKVMALGGDSNISQIIMLVQARCFALYFSPANFYFCYNSEHQCEQMLVEVSNTPWNERHYYLVNLSDDLEGKRVSDKAFHVSPFMDLAMKYYWSVKPPMPDKERLLIHIASHRYENLENGQFEKTDKVFDATLMLNKRPFTQSQLMRVWISLPVMSLKIVAGIYWQALRLLIKRIPFVAYQKAK